MSIHLTSFPQTRQFLGFVPRPGPSFFTFILLQVEVRWGEGVGRKRRSGGGVKEEVEGGKRVTALGWRLLSTSYGSANRKPSHVTLTPHAMPSPKERMSQRVTLSAAHSLTYEQELHFCKPPPTSPPRCHALSFASSRVIWFADMVTAGGSTGRRRAASRRVGGGCGCSCKDDEAEEVCAKAI